MNSDAAVVKYFIYKKMDHDLGQKYGYYKRIIGYVLDTTDIGFIRKTFLNLVKNKHFIKIKNSNKKSYLYKFYNSDIKREEKVKKDPNYYIISWE